MLVEGALSSLLQPIDLNAGASLVVSLDAEWNVSRQTGVSILQIAPHSSPTDIVIVTGNPGVSQGYPDPYPHKPVPVVMGTGLRR
jgi:hypothetical protein